MNNYKRRVAAASLATVAILGINARIDNDRVFQQAKTATEDQIPYAAPVQHRNNPPVGYLAVMVATVNLYPCQEDDECWDCESMGNKLCVDKTINGGNQSD